MDPMHVLTISFRNTLDRDAVRRAFKVGFTVPQIMTASGWSHDAVYMAIEGH